MDPRRRKVVLLASLCAMLSGLSPLLHTARFPEGFAFVKGLVIGLMFTLTIGSFVKMKRLS